MLDRTLNQPPSQSTTHPDRHTVPGYGTLDVDHDQIVWRLSAREADNVLTRLALGGATSDPVLALYQAIAEATEPPVRSRVQTCQDLWPDAAPFRLTQPALLGSFDGDLLAVLIPGCPSPVEATTVAVDLACAAGADISQGDPRWIAEVWQPHWMLLNTCEGAHDFHPELVTGPSRPGAAMLTRVDLHCLATRR